MLIGRPPFETSNVKTTYKRIKMNFYTFPDHITISKEAKNLIQRLLKKEPECRLSLDKILEHEFLKDPIPESLPVSAMACPPPPELARTISGKATASESSRPNTRPQSSVREVVTQRRNIFVEKGKEDTSQQKSRGCSQNDRGMMMSNRCGSTNDLHRARSISRNEDISSSKNERTVKRAGSAIHRCLTRNRTEQYLMSARNRFENKQESKTKNYESQFSKYNKAKSKRNGRESTSVGKYSNFESKSKISAIHKTIDYNSAKAKSQQPGVKVEYASTLGPNESGKVLISKWVDYSSKYGVGYKLSDGCYGVLFNDSTKMLLNPNCFDFIYIRRENSGENEPLKNLTDYYDFSSYPESLKKKVILLQHFKSYLDGIKFEVPKSAPFPKTDYNEIFLKKWRRAKKAILFRLSNKVIQVVFQDVSELILSSGSGSVTFITAKREVRNSPLYHDLEKKDPSLFKRLNYAKEILMHMINPGKNSNSKGIEGDKENFNERDGAVTSRPRDPGMLGKLGMHIGRQKSAFETNGLVTSRSRPKLKF